MSLESSQIATIIVAVISGGALTAIINWWKERKTASAQVKLTDVQTLQAKLVYLEQVAENLFKHNERLQEDYNESEERNRKLRQQVSEMEIELDKVRRSAKQTQHECEELAKKLAAITEGDGHL